MALASKPKKLKDYFYDILNHINWDLIKPSLEETKLFSQDELTSIWCNQEKRRLKCIFKKITDSDKERLFLQALKHTSHDVGHQELIKLLQDIDSTGKHFIQSF